MATSPVTTPTPGAAVVPTFRTLDGQLPDFNLPYRPVVPPTGSGAGGGSPTVGAPATG
jgi:hypothetical protein